MMARSFRSSSSRPWRPLWGAVVGATLIAVTLVGVGPTSASPAALGAGSNGTPLADASAPFPGAAPTPTVPHAEVIPILPSAGTASKCVTQHPAKTNRQYALRKGALETNVYAAPHGTTGLAGLCYDAATGSLLGYVNWTHVGGKGGWFSYPEVAYGVDEYGPNDTYTHQNPKWALPESVATITNKSLWVTASYDYHPPPASQASGDDLSFDNYFSEGLPPSFENGTPWVELLVLLSHQVWSNPSEWVAWNMSTLVNSTVVNATWDIGWWCHGSGNTSSPSVTFDFSYGGSPRTTTGLTSGTLGVNLSAIVAELEHLLPHASCWTGTADPFSGFELGQEVFGAEAGVHTKGPFEYNWTISRYCFHVGVVGLRPAEVECPGLANASELSPTTGGSAGLPGATPGAASAALLVARPAEPWDAPAPDSPGTGAGPPDRTFESLR